MFSTELDGKRQEILIEAVPGLRRMAALADSDTTTSPQLKALQDAARGAPRDSARDGLRLLPRDLILQLHANPNVSLGGGYRNYPGFSAAQVREKFGVGW